MPEYDVSVDRPELIAPIDHLSSIFKQLEIIAKEPDGDCLLEAIGSKVEKLLKRELTDEEWFKLRKENPAALGL